MVEFMQGLKYPWGNAKRLWNILWILIPILGWFAIINYSKKISLSIVGGDTAGLPEFGGFFENLSKGFILFLKLIPISVVLMIVNFIPVIGSVVYVLFAILFMPWLVINLYVKDTVGATFEWSNAANIVFKNFGDYVMTIIKTIGFVVVYLVGSIVVVGIPCLYLGQYFFFADFYARNKPAAKPQA